MAKTSTINYISRRNLKDVYPSLDSYDSKVLLYGFTEQEASQTKQNSVDIYQHSNSGLVTALYRDGNDLDSGKQTIATTQIALINEELDVTETRINVDNYVNFVSSFLSYIKIGDEIMWVTAVTNDTNDYIDVVRGRLGTTATTHTDDTPAYQHFTPSADGQWLYDDDNDFVVMAVTNSTNPSDNVMESGEDVDTLLTRTMTRASRMFESELDSRLSREVRMDREGLFPEYVIRAVSLKSIVMLMQSQDPDNPIIDSFNEEYKEIVEGYRSGNIQMPTSVTADSAKGVIRDIVYTPGSIRPVDTRGYYNGDFDILKIKITGAGIIGACRYTIWGKDNDKLGINEGYKIVDDEIINGQYQPLAYGMFIRFAGGTNSVTAVLNNEFEIELKGTSLETSVSQIGSIQLTRR